MTSKPLASVSLDLDNLWAYLKIHNDPGWEKFPSYFDRFIPHVLEMLDHLGLKITFFITGQDASMQEHKELLKLLSAGGHEIGNHSFRHESWLELYSKKDIEDEIVHTDEQITLMTGQKPVGFRGPGFSWSSDVFDVLSKNGYLYDTSTFPTYIGPLARRYYFAKSNLSKEDKEERRNLYGSFLNGRLSVQPFFWNLGSTEKLLEIPVTTMPFLKIPFHLSYLLFLSRFSPKLMMTYLNTAIRLCKWSHSPPTFLLHPLDLMSRDQIPELSFFPGMEISAERKRHLFNAVLEKLGRHFTLVRMSQLAREILKNGDNLKSVPTLP